MVPMKKLFLIFKLILIALFIFMGVSCTSVNKELPDSSSVGKYNRKSWKHWIDKDSDCLNTRHELLKARSLVPVTTNKKGCRVLRGKWADYYYDEFITDATKIDIDHVVPLKHAFDSGGRSWSAEKKKRFANDEENLVITLASYNRKKGSSSITKWLPINKKYAGKYVKKWLKIKKKYGLVVSKEEMEVMKHLQGAPE